MLADIPLWMGDVHRVLPPHYVGALVTVTAVLCGAAVGYERGKREKPAGVRTMMLICLGSCIFTQAGILMAADWADRTRVAAQVVTGVGFLGAGAIFRERGYVRGFTTGAAIWAVAAIGLVLGAGYVVAGAAFTILAGGTLWAETWLERWLYGPCRMMSVRVNFDPQNGRTRRAIESVLDDFQVPDEQVRFEPPTGEGVESVILHHCRQHRHHRAYLGPICAIGAVRSVVDLPENETR